MSGPERVAKQAARVAAERMMEPGTRRQAPTRSRRRGRFVIGVPLPSATLDETKVLMRVVARLRRAAGVVAHGKSVETAQGRGEGRRPGQPSLSLGDKASRTRAHGPLRALDAPPPKGDRHCGAPSRKSPLGCVSRIRSLPRILSGYTWLVGHGRYGYGNGPRPVPHRGRGTGSRRSNGRGSDPGSSFHPESRSVRRAPLRRRTSRREQVRSWRGASPWGRVVLGEWVAPQAIAGAG